MEEAILSVAVDRLHEIITYEIYNLAGVDQLVREIELQLQVITPYFERIQVLPQIPHDFHHWIEDTRNVVRGAEDLIGTYAKSVSERRNATIYKKPMYQFKLRHLRKELRKIRLRAEVLQHAMPNLNHLPEGRGHHENSIPSYLTQCIYYFRLFPADFEVPARRLLVLWVAESLVRAKENDRESVEHIAESYLNKLIDLGMVSVTRNRIGRVKTCWLKDGTRDAWLTKAKEASFFTDKAGNVRRLVDPHDTDDTFIQLHGDPRISHSVPNYKDIISFLSFDTQEGSKPGEDIGDFLHKCILAGCFMQLRVLDLERVFRPKLPKTLRKLIRLKYLGLRWTCLEDLPKFVNRLLNLQVLDVKHTYISALPRTIWSMQYLRHLYLSETYRTRFLGRPSGTTLTALQTLWGATIDEDTCVTDGLDTLENVRKLGLSCRPRSSQNSHHMSKQLNDVDRWISRLKFLESLRLKSRDMNGKASDLHLSSLKDNKDLSTVYLLGKLNPQVVREFPVSLTDITLSGSELDLDPMPFLGTLPKLLILRLLGRSVAHNTIHCSRGGFPVLKFLYIWKLENLENWEAEDGSLPSLEELEIRSCENLKTLPDQLQHVNTLKKLSLTSMPGGFTDDIKKNKSHLWDKIESIVKS